MKHGFLPVSREDMKKQNIDQLDFVYVIGDAYVDHSLSEDEIRAGFEAVSL